MECNKIAAMWKLHQMWTKRQMRTLLNSSSMASPFLVLVRACRSSFIPFMCLQLFPLCDGNGTPHKPTKDQCISISTVVCKEEWQKALTFPSVREMLPDCESLSVTTENICKGIYLYCPFLCDNCCMFI